ncbi:MAG: AAA family ATPase [Clostridia bacterium]
MAQKELNLINMEEVDAKAVDWLWYPFLPIGQISIVQGDPSEGKTTFILQVIALLTRGKKLPFDEQERSPMNVI